MFSLPTKGQIVPVAIIVLGTLLVLKYVPAPEAVKQHFRP